VTQAEGTPESLQAEQAGYKHTLGRRHVQMIAIGGAIGTGLFLGSASRLHTTGPALLFSYAFVGVIAYFLMRALGELVLHRATSGAFVSYMREFFGEGAAYVTGWMYWLNWALTGIAELSAVGLYIQYWFEDMPTWATVLVALAVVLVVNLLSARAFGEFEFWASIAKVGAIVVFMVVGIVVVAGRVHIGDHRAGLSNLWSNPGGFWPTSGAFDWYGPILVMSGVVFAYAAIEMVGVAAGEMENAKREVPKAVNAVIFRIAIFYCGSILLLVAMLPTSEYEAGTSPFVTVFDRMGFSWMGSLIQAVLIVAAMSSLNSGLYSTGRVLRSLGMSKQAPAFTLKMSSSGVPWAGIVMTSLVFVLGAVLNAVMPNAFEVALEAAALGVVFTWATIFLCQLRLRSLTRRGVIPPSPFQMPGSPYTSIIGLVFLASIIVGLTITGWQSSPYFWHKTTFLVVVFGIPVIAAVLGLGWLVVKPKVVANTGGRLKAVWSNDGPTYGPDYGDKDLYGDQNGVFGLNVPPLLRQAGSTRARSPYGEPPAGPGAGGRRPHVGRSERPVGAACLYQDVESS
jgi:L-asparagine permease